MLGTKSIQLGVPRAIENGKKWYSSWNRTRIQEWVEKQEPCGDAIFQFRTDLLCS
jgi:hypothetical protein